MMIFSSKITSFKWQSSAVSFLVFSFFVLVCPILSAANGPEDIEIPLDAGSCTAKVPSTSATFTNAPAGGDQEQVNGKPSLAFDIAGDIVGDAEFPIISITLPAPFDINSYGCIQFSYKFDAKLVSENPLFQLYFYDRTKNRGTQYGGLPAFADGQWHRITIPVRLLQRSDPMDLENTETILVAIRYPTTQKVGYSFKIGDLVLKKGEAPQDVLTE